MRQDDILLNEIYSKINSDFLVEGILDFAKNKIKSIWNTANRNDKRNLDKEIVNVLSNAAEKLKNLGVNPEEYLNPKAVRGMVTPPNLSTPSNMPSNEPVPVTEPTTPASVPVTSKPPVVSVNSKPTSSIPQKKRTSAIYNSIKPGELGNILKGKDPMGYKVPDDLKDPKTNKMTGPDVMEYLGVDLEELNYLVTKLKAFSFKNNKIDVSDVEGNRYLRIQQALKDREETNRTPVVPKKPTVPKKTTAVKKPTATKKLAATKKPTVVKKQSKK